MRTLYLLRHGLTMANERRLYSGAIDLPLSPAGRDAARAMREARPLPACDVCLTSGMARANETLALLTGREPDAVLPGFREMAFGAFELRAYDELRSVPAYVRWIEDATGDVACPGGECRNGFRERVLREGRALLQRPEDSALVVCHGGVIVNLMQAWFPSVERHFYQWQPAACRGYRIAIAGGVPEGFEEV